MFIPIRSGAPAWHVVAVTPEGQAIANSTRWESKADAQAYADSIQAKGYRIDSQWRSQRVASARVEAVAEPVKLLETRTDRRRRLAVFDMGDGTQRTHDVTDIGARAALRHYPRLTAADAMRLAAFCARATPQPDGSVKKELACGFSAAASISTKRGRCLSASYFDVPEQGMEEGMATGACLFAEALDMATDPASASALVRITRDAAKNAAASPGVNDRSTAWAAVRFLDMLAQAAMYAVHDPKAHHRAQHVAQWFTEQAAQARKQEARRVARSIAARKARRAAGKAGV